MTSTAGALCEFIENAGRLFVLTGAGCSTDNGIPDYRSPSGAWSRHRPVYFPEFTRSAATRRLYWARSARGRRRFADARPNAAHLALAEMERRGKLHHLVTQNVDGLHQKAGSARVVDLHGRNDVVVCLGCGARSDHEEMQQRLVAGNGEWFEARRQAEGRLAPDGDFDMNAEALEGFEFPDCECGGVLKPDVVFFGESVPRGTVDFAMARLAESDRVLVVGSSLAVWSGYRFALAAEEQGKPVAIVNIGVTEAVVIPGQVWSRDDKSLRVD
ncbi:MAG: NAD-dependent protein deacetylase [Thermoanaerobaculia bacterium]